MTNTSPSGAQTESSAAYMQVQRLRKAFGTVQAVDTVSFDVRRGEFLTLLGPSGCGKSTTLRLIAGLQRPDEGEIQVEGRLITSARHRVFVTPEKRGMGMVFQSYAVCPHMTVFGKRGIPAARAKKARR